MAQVEWLGAVTAQETLRQAVGPCFSRWANDCITLENDYLRRKGLFSDCEKLLQAVDAATDEEWDSFVESTEYCPGYFDYDEMPNGRGRTTKKSSGVKAVAVGAVAMAVGLLVATKIF